EHDFDAKKPESEVILSPSSSAQSRKQDDKIKKEAKGKIPTVEQNSLNSTNTFSTVGHSNAAVSLTYGKSLFIDASQLPDDLDMLELKDITYSDDEDVVGAEADFNNLESSIPEPKRVYQALKDPSWIEAMQEELLLFKMQKVWFLVDLPHGKRAIGTKWVYRNKKDERGMVIRNKARLISQGHTQEGGIDYEEVFALVARIETIRLFLAYASFMGFMVYQMDMNSAFLYGTIEEEVYVVNPQGLRILIILTKYTKWSRHFMVYIKLLELVSTPIDTEKPLLKDPDGEDVDVHTYRSMIVKRILRYLKGKPHLGLWYAKDLPFDLVAYSDSDYAGASLDRKSTSGGCQFLGCRLISWQCKKQTVIGTSSTEAEYVAAASCGAQLLWIQNQLLDYGPDHTVSGKDKSNPLMADNLPTIVWYSTHHVSLMKSWLIKKQTALGKDKSKPLMADNLPTIVWYSTHHVSLMKSWLIKKQTALGKDKSKPLMADNLPKIVWYSIHHISLMKSWLVQKQTALGQTTTGKEISNPFMAEGVDYLSNEEIFVELARMGYEKPSTKLTFYKAFFLSQWKFLIYTILQSLSAKRTSWNEFSSAMASAVICLSTGRKFNFSKYIFDSLVINVDSTSKFYMYPRFIQLLIRNQIGDLSTYTTKYTSPALTQKVFANMRRVGKGFSRVKTPLFEGMLVEQVLEKGGDEEEHVQDVADHYAAQGDDTHVQRDDAPEPTIRSPTPPTPPPQPPQELPSTSQVQPTLLQSPQPQPQPQPQAPQQAADFPMSLLQEALDACAAFTRRVEHLEYDKVAQALEIIKLKRRVKKLEKENRVKVLKLRRLKRVGTSQRVDTSEDTVMDDASNQGRIIDDLDKDDVVALLDDKEEDKMEEEAKVVVDDQVQGRQAKSQAKIYEIDLDHASKVLSMQEDEPAEVHEVVDVVTTAKLITKVVTAASETVTAASTIISAAKP
nr:ribonuclease H-like domain-containing protein [Tanacetum cinerariifolium]